MCLLSKMFWKIKKYLTTVFKKSRKSVRSSPRNPFNRIRNNKYPRKRTQKHFSMYFKPIFMIFINSQWISKSSHQRFFIFEISSFTWPEKKRTYSNFENRNELVWMDLAKKIIDGGKSFWAQGQFFLMIFGTFSNCSPCERSRRGLFFRPKIGFLREEHHFSSLNCFKLL